VRAFSLAKGDSCRTADTVSLDSYEAMYSPRSSQATGTKAAVPEGFGIAIPSNPHDLLKLIQQQHKRNVSKANQNSNIIGRAQKQEQQREVYENKLMEFEDFIYKPEGAERLQRHFEHLRM